MAHPNEQLLRTNYAAVAIGDLGPMLDSLSDDIRWRVSGPSPLAGEYSGKDEVVQFFGRMMELYGGTLQVDVVDVLAGDDNGVVLVSERAEYAGRAAAYTGIHRYEFRAGKCVRFENLYDDAYHAFWRAAQR